ncbi:MAG: glycosyltransferase family 4 protein [Solirubrobacterales bacterium]
MHVGLNLIYLVPGETGGSETYARELIPALRESAPELRLTAFINRETAAAGEGPWTELAEAVVVPIHAENRIDWVRGEQLLLPRLAARSGIDLLHNLAHTGPVWGRLPAVMTLHDLIFLMESGSHFGLRRWGVRVLMPAATRRSKRVIAISESTRDDAISRLNIPAERIDVVPQGYGARPLTDYVGEPELRRRLGLDGRALALSVSTKRPHKNLPRLLEAQALIPEPERPLLVLPGYSTQHEAELRTQAAELGIAQDVRFLGWLSADELEGLYRASTCFVFPSRYEGFGLPVLEAMARGLPVACGRAKAVLEVAGDAALVFDHERPEEIAGAIRSLLADGELRQRLSDAGRLRAAQFTWERTARGTIESYRRALS